MPKQSRPKAHRVSIPALTPAQFEQFVEMTLRQLDFFQSAEIKRNAKLAGVRQPGEYEIDIVIRAQLAGVADFLMIIECKNWNRPVDRPLVQKLAQTRDAVSAHKAVMVSPIGFTKEAIAVADTLGVALWVLAEGSSRFGVVLGYSADLSFDITRILRISALNLIGFRFEWEDEDRLREKGNPLDDDGRPVRLTFVDAKLIYGQPGRKVWQISRASDGSRNERQVISYDEDMQLYVSEIKSLPLPLYAISGQTGIGQDLKHTCEAGYDKRLGSTQLADEIWSVWRSPPPLPDAGSK
jgi:hypothetical protein